jgi:hypothetical protein
MEVGMKVRVAAVLFVLMFAVAAFAHGDKVHVMGTLEKVGADSVSVKTADGKSVEVKLAATTVYIFRDGKTKEGTPAKVTDLAVGQRVIIHATPKGKDLIADEVKFAAAGAATAPKPATH